MRISKTALLCFYFFYPFLSVFSQGISVKLDLPDQLIVDAYEKAAMQNVLTAVNPKIFFGYFSVCADGKGFGYGNTYPSLDGHQMSDALLWLGQTDVVKANWDYVKKFQKQNGALPLAILPASAGKNIGPKNFETPVDPNGGLYKHWVPKDPLRALAGVTYIQNADVIFRYTQDRKWLLEHLPSVNLTADYLASMISEEGAVGGAGYYIERPTRVEFDGVSQCHAADAFFRLAGLNKVAGNKQAARKYETLAHRIENNFRTRFWVRDHFAEYIHPTRGIIENHGLTDIDWSAIALGTADRKQTVILWPRLKNEKLFYYGGMPTGITTKPDSYEEWEYEYPDNQDLASMGRVWYLEALARTRMKDAEGLIESIRIVCKEGKNHDYYWRERYNSAGGYGAEKYNEYPANLIRIIQRCLFGIEYGLDGTLYIEPTVPDEYWRIGFGQTLNMGHGMLIYKMKSDSFNGKYDGNISQPLAVAFKSSLAGKRIEVAINGEKSKYKIKNDKVYVTVPSAAKHCPCLIEIKSIRPSNVS